MTRREAVARSRTEFRVPNREFLLGLGRHKKMSLLEKRVERAKRGHAILNLGLFYIGSHKEVVQYLIRSLPECTELVELNLCRTELVDEDALFLAGVLPRLEALHKLYLDCNAIGDFGAQCISRVLPYCKSLTTITLAGNPIGNEGAQWLADAIPRCPTLTSVYLWKTKVSDQEIISSIEARTKENINNKQLA
jgi:Ran GTPase-activating protein (RanGAP) involved in mRNA processing and transport